MNPVQEIHNRAMDIASDAYAGEMFKPGSRLYKSPEELTQLYQAAYKLEKQAAEMVAVGEEPTRGILYRSASWLAKHAGEIEEACKLAQTGLGGNPPEWLALELKEVLTALETVKQ